MAPKGKKRSTTATIITKWQYKLKDGHCDYSDLGPDQIDQLLNKQTLCVDDLKFKIDLASLKGTSSGAKTVFLRKIESAAEAATTNGSKQEPEVKKIKFRGRVPVDPALIEKHGDGFVVYEENEVVYDCMLNQTNITNNNNKFYLIQLVEEVAENEYQVWCRWGRVGATGQSSINGNGTLARAKAEFCKKFKAKTNNDWPDCLSAGFVKNAGLYDLIARDFSVQDNCEEDLVVSTKISSIKAPESSLDKRLQSLIEMICNVRSIEQSLKELNFDTKRSPLGKLSRDQIKLGYTALNDIEKLILRKSARNELSLASDAYYTRIPHIFGMKQPPVIADMDAIKSELLLLDALTDAEAAIRVLVDTLTNENPIDQRYRQLNCQLNPIDSHTDLYQKIDQCLQTTHGSTHNLFQLELIDAFEVERQGEHDRFKDLGENQFLLWHGSRLMNWAGIVSQGLRIAPPEAPVTGYMFGKGVYFADCSSKSSNYCATSKSANVGLLLLAEVSLGSIHDQIKAEYNFPRKLPRDKQSVRGLGRIVPDESKSQIMPSGAKIQFGPLKDNSSSTTTTTTKFSLMYNEYVVYDVAQIKMKYLLRVRFNYKRRGG